MQFLLAILVALWPAQPASPTDLNADTVQSSFVAAGYAADAPIQYANGIATIAVHSGAETPGWPTVRAFVYTDPAAADLARKSDQLLAGYGAPLWQGNVALIQVSKNPAAFPTEPDCVPALESPAPVVLDTVDSTFAGVLFNRGGDL